MRRFPTLGLRRALADVLLVGATIRPLRDLDGRPVTIEVDEEATEGRQARPPAGGRTSAAVSHMAGRGSAGMASVSSFFGLLEGEALPRLRRLAGRE